MLKNYKKIRALVITIFIMLILMVLAIELVKVKGYYLIYDWMYFIIIYAILFLSILLCSKNKYLKWTVYSAILIIFILNTKGLLDVSKDKVLIFKSSNLKNEIIIKEVIKKQDGADNVVKALDLKRKFYLFGKQMDEYPTENLYRSFSSGTYKVNWIKDNIATVNYLCDKDGDIKQHVYTFNFENPIRYSYVTASITGIWADKENPNNTLNVENGKFIYVKDGQTFVYDTANAEQKGYNAVVFKGEGRVPDLSIVSNEGNIIGNNCLLNKGATLFIGYVSLEDEKYGLFERVGGGD
ncbi:hypothetical protein [Clostridium uliginosum]|uniref:Uncharacterized protein n=1 Tax=Clostridium uliginosum TaxID=119641 RepID=A0A1I1JGD7_9CLOT|nr:hypothetical protein [Clostridium uliginosum]SFC47536.1 hypothetical protein SAMN05421842_10416 [Clostridium uliginosum]